MGPGLVGIAVFEGNIPLISAVAMRPLSVKQRRERVTHKEFVKRTSEQAGDSSKSKETDGPSKTLSVDERLAAAKAGREAFDSVVRKLGISKESMQRVWSTTSDKELLEQARYERMVERGLASGETEAR